VKAEQTAQAHGYDYAQRLSDLCCAWDSQRPPIAAEILGQVAQVEAALAVAVRERDQARDALRRIAEGSTVIDYDTPALAREIARAALEGQT
jgi:hypothetical protein